ncbi:helix-turn-helix domain-containing protein [bacterium]|nr:helix-turn-helix domain-containing protein [bacterium]
MNILSELGTRVSDLRRQKGISRKELARRAHLSVRFLADVESGRGNISLNRLAGLCKALNIPPSLLLSGIWRMQGADSRSRLLDSIFSMMNRCDAKQLKELYQWLSNRLQQKQELIALIGLRGAGKTTIGKKLAAAMKWEFVELDERIEKAAGLTLQNIFEVHGEEYYRKLEQEVLLDLILQQKRAVVATGGGIVMRNETFDLLESHCKIVWLKARPEDHWNRVLNQDPRPMTNYPNAFAQLQNLLQGREPLYAKADCVIDTSVLGIQGSVKEIISQVGAM